MIVFYLQEGSPYVVPEQKSWGDVAKMLNAYFKKNTGRGLTEEQLKYLGRRALGICVLFKCNVKYIDG